MKAYVFPGQGSQQKGMGNELFDLFPEYVEQADAILGYSIRELCSDDPHEQLNLTQFTQPALFTVNALTYLAQKKQGLSVDYLAGHSLGEYNALFAAEVFNFETGLKIVQKRGELMGRAVGGGMAAVLACDAETVATILKEKNLSNLDIANYNSPKQTVISGPVSDLEAAEAHFAEARAMFIPLNVSAAFHSRYMQSMSEEFSTFLQEFTFASFSTPVVANVTAELYRDEDVCSLLTQQLSRSVRWTDTIRFLTQAGVEEYEELGPGNVLTKLIKQIKKAYK